ncbi:MAG: hypothetical protein ABUL60_24310 [Myxococcales bacterium]
MGLQVEQRNRMLLRMQVPWPPWKMRVPSLVLLVGLVVVGIGGAASGAEAYGADRLADKAAAKKRLSDAQVKKLLIEESIAAYDGNCPCPYSRARNGSRCGRRSAYSREGGAAPLCFAADVSAEMVEAYRQEHAEE